MDWEQPLMAVHLGRQTLRSLSSVALSFCRCKHHRRFALVLSSKKYYGHAMTPWTA